MKNLMHIFFLTVLFNLSVPLHALTLEVEKLDSYRVEGLYEIDASYVDNTEKKLPKLNRLAVFRTFDNESYSLSLANGDSNTPWIIFRNVVPTFQENQIIFHAEGDLANGIFGEILIKFNRNTLLLNGEVSDSNSAGSKIFTGKPIYNLNDCIFKGIEETGFPQVNELMGEYSDGEGSTLLLKKYSSGALSMSVSFLYDATKNVTFDVLFNRGRYSQDLGLLSFPFDSQRGIQGRANLTYWKDSEGKSYLKLFMWGSGGVAKILKFRPLKD